jgi:hypothetical protein
MYYTEHTECDAESGRWVRDRVAGAAFAIN